LWGLLKLAGYQADVTGRVFAVPVDRGLMHQQKKLVLRVVDFYKLKHAGHIS
jgi:hemolysin-activating ACP:hemolysin acyltransferase